MHYLDLKYINLKQSIITAANKTEIKLRKFCIASFLYLEKLKRLELNH